MWSKSLFVIILSILCSHITECSQHTKYEDKTELLQAIVITRHGDRTPTKLFPNTKSEWPEGLGQLTHIGMQQHYELGQKFRKIYIDEKKLVSGSYHPEEVYVRSSPKERTLMSAHSFMSGFFPPGSGLSGIPGGIQPVPIYSSDKTSDRLLYAYKNCPRLKTLVKDVYKLKEWEEMTTKHSSLLAKLSDIFGHKFTLRDVTTALNLINGETIHNRTKTDGITSEMLHTMKEIANWVFKRKFHSKEMGKLGAGLLVHELRVRFNETISSDLLGKKSKHRFVLFSAHDGTLLALMSALGLTHLEVPPYASHLVFELHKDKEFNKYHVNILYNDEIVEFPNCTLAMYNFCHFDHWTSLIEAGVPLDWDSECRIPEDDYFFWKSEFFPFILCFLMGVIVHHLKTVYIRSDKSNSNKPKKKEEKKNN